jgi:hypothetical protein
MSELFLVTLIAPPALEETLVDWLLNYESRYGFSTYPLSGHSSRLEGLTLAEQVSGRKGQIGFQIHLPETEWPGLIECLRRNFSGAGVHYWVSPLVDHGRV